MANIVNGHTKEKIQNFSVETVRNLLNIDNKEIAKLCSQVSMMPKKDSLGKTYFTAQEIETLRQRKKFNEQAIKSSQSQKSYATVPVKSMVQQFKNLKIAQPPVNKPLVKQSTQSSKVEAPVAVPQKSNGAVVVEKICSSLSVMENNLTTKMADLIDKKLEEKLDGMDEVVVELVRCKTENETLRYKMNELNKELYNLKNELSRYKSIGLGFYVKKNGDSSLL